MREFKDEIRQTLRKTFNNKKADININNAVLRTIVLLKGPDGFESDEFKDEIKQILGDLREYNDTIIRSARMNEIKKL